MSGHSIDEGDKSTERFEYIEIIIDPSLIPQGADWLFTMTDALFGKTGRTWESWLEEMHAKNQ